MKKGDIVSVIFPFTDLSASKRRPALVLYVADNDVMLFFITSKVINNGFSVKILSSSINNLQVDSTIILTKIFTGSRSLIKGKIGEVEKHYYPSINKIIFSLLSL